MLCQQYIPVSVYKIIFTKTDKNLGSRILYKKRQFLNPQKIIVTNLCFFFFFRKCDASTPLDKMTLDIIQTLTPACLLDNRHFYLNFIKQVLRVVHSISPSMASIPTMNIYIPICCMFKITGVNISVVDISHSIFFHNSFIIITLAVFMTL